MEKRELNDDSYLNNNSANNEKDILRMFFSHNIYFRLRNVLKHSFLF